MGEHNETRGMHPQKSLMGWTTLTAIALSLALFGCSDGGREMSNHLRSGGMPVGPAAGGVPGASTDLPEPVMWAEAVRGRLTGQFGPEGYVDTEAELIRLSAQGPITHVTIYDREIDSWRAMVWLSTSGLQTLDVGETIELMEDDLHIGICSAPEGSWESHPDIGTLTLLAQHGDTLSFAAQAGVGEDRVFVDFDLKLR